MQEITRSPADFDAEGSLAVLEDMLVECAAKHVKGTRIDIVVSDSLGITVALPWHAALNSMAERQAFSAACFEQAGMDAGNDWVVRGEYRHYGGMGMAYALPRVWMVGLLAMLQNQGLTLGSVLPLSGLAYWRHAAPRGTGNLIVLQEALRNTVLIFDGDRFSGLDVEPDAGSAERAGKRLMSRIQSRANTIATVGYWTPNAAAQAPEFLRSAFPDARLLALPPNKWNAYE
ncbi:hypothetical protein NHH88_19460 [Oxalobacteraceae bacterium OTU3CAMAD1]|nr:hypothetical protein NHH88_19460 [Oxalobacteraceae bacterium OTU3CAMAD1]